MTKRILDNLTNEELVEQYTALSLKQFNALYVEDESGIRNYNRLYRAIHAIASVLRARGIEARRTLIPLLTHKNAQVSLNAANELLAVVPAEAYAAMERLAESAPGPQRLRARMDLRFLAQGIYPPT